jgi:hypothetical protein
MQFAHRKKYELICLAYISLLLLLHPTMQFFAWAEQLDSDGFMQIGGAAFCLHMYFLTLAYLDIRSGFAQRNRPALRAILCVLLATVAALLLEALVPVGVTSFDPVWLVAGAVGGGALGCLGTFWP